MASDSSSTSIWGYSGGVLVNNNTSTTGNSSTTISNSTSTITLTPNQHQAYYNYSYTYPTYPALTTPEGKILIDIKEMYDYVSKLYFDSQMKEVINEDADVK